MAWFIKFDGVPGESKDKSHTEWTDMMSINFGISMAGGGETGQSRRRGTARFHDIVVTQEADKSGPKLAESITVKGKIFDKVEIHDTATFGSARGTYIKFELTDVKVTSYQFSGSSSGDSKPIESYSLNYGQIKHSYIPHDNKGNPQGPIQYGVKTEEGESA